MIRIAIVTGAAGFIGQNLCRRLLDKGVCVLGIDNFSSSSPHSFNVLNISAAKCGSADLFRSIVADVTDESSYIATVKDIIDLASLVEDDVDLAIWHLACPASPAAYSRHPIKTTLTSVLGTKNFIDLLTYAATLFSKAKNTKKARMLFTSTSEVYGNPISHPQREVDNGNVSIRGPRACYDEGKRVAETLCADSIREWARETGGQLDIRTVRLFNTYGPYMRADDGRVVSNFINQALNNKPLTVYGDGSQTRSFCYIDDTLDALEKIMSCEQRDIEGPFNVGNPEEITVLELANAISTLVHGSSDSVRIVNESAKEDDPVVRCPDISKLKARIKWRPWVTLNDGLVRTISYFRAVQQEQNELTRQLNTKD